MLIYKFDFLKKTIQGRERQQFHETLASFQKARNLSETGEFIFS